MKFAATFAACALAAAALTGCDTTEETTSVNPGAVSADCCGSCGGDEVAPGAVGEGACGAADACGEASACSEAPAAMGAVKESDCGASCASESACSGE